MKNDTIAAIATAPGVAGISVIRISGDSAKTIIERIFRPIAKNCKYIPQRMYLGDLYSGNNFIDQCFAVYFKKPNSYTGEDVIEIQCHGGDMVSEMILDTVITSGARIAEPGEFTKRAFLNGKIDLSQAESIMDLIGSLSEKSAIESAKALKGSIKSKIDDLQNQLSDVIAQIEAVIEYPEEDLEAVVSSEQEPVIEKIYLEIKRLSDSYKNGKIIRNGINAVIIGRPNVGKSSLLNLILDENRAIVTHIPGTTRDTLTEYFVYKSIPIIITDTAGVRETDDDIEKIGVEKSIEAISGADIVLFVLDSSESISDEDKLLYEKIADKRHLIVLNKSDLAAVTNEDTVFKCFDAEPISISCKTRQGKDELLDMIVSSTIDKGNESMTILRERQYSSLKKAQSFLNTSLYSIKRGMDLDCVSIDLKEAWFSLGEITGKSLTEDIIDRIFEKFCLGK